MDQSVNPHISYLVILFTLPNFFPLPLQNSSLLSEFCHDTHRQEDSIICLLSRHYCFLDWTTLVNILYEICVIAFPPSSSPTQPWFLCLIFEPGFKFSCLKKKSSCSVFIVLTPCTEAAVQRNPRVVKPPSNVRPLHKPDVIKGHQTARGPHPRHHLKDFATNAKVIRAEKTDGIPWLKGSEPQTPRSANREKRGSDRSRGGCEKREKEEVASLFLSFFFFITRESCRHLFLLGASTKLNADLSARAGSLGSVNLDLMSGNFFSCLPKIRFPEKLLLSPCLALFRTRRFRDVRVATRWSSFISSSFLSLNKDRKKFTSVFVCPVEY